MEIAESEVSSATGPVGCHQVMRCLQCMKLRSELSSGSWGEEESPRIAVVIRSLVDELGVVVTSYRSNARASCYCLCISASV